MGAVALEKGGNQMLEKNGFYFVDSIDEVGVVRRHCDYLEDRSMLKNMGHMLEKDEIDHIQVCCAAYEHAMAILLPESKQWSDSEWLDADGVAEKVLEKYTGFFENTEDGSAYMYDDVTSYYEMVLKLLERHFDIGEEIVELFMYICENRDLVVFVARLLHPDRYEEYMLEVFAKIAKEIIAEQKKRQKTGSFERDPDDNFTKSYLYQYVLSLQHKEALTKKMKRLLHTVTMIG